MPYPIEWPIPAVVDTFATVLTVSTLVRPANNRRADCEFVNDSDYTMYLARGNAAVVGSGIRLNANGGSYTIGAHNLFLGAVYAICDGQQEEGNLTISEGTAKQ